MFLIREAMCSSSFEPNVLELLLSPHLEMFLVSFLYAGSSGDDLHKRGFAWSIACVRVVNLLDWHPNLQQQSSFSGFVSIRSLGCALHCRLNILSSRVLCRKGRLLGRLGLDQRWPPSLQQESCAVRTCLQPCSREKDIERMEQIQWNAHPTPTLGGASYPLRLDVHARFPRTHSRSRPCRNACAASPILVSPTR